MTLRNPRFLTITTSRMMSFEILRRVALVRTDVSEEPGYSFIRVTRIGELGTTQAAKKLVFLRSVTSQKTPFFIVTAMKTSNLTITPSV
jgi:hypothetical protein